MATLREIRATVAEMFAQTSFFPRTNETYYPASWVYGDGADDASTSDPYDVRLTRAGQAAAREYDLVIDEWEFQDMRRQRDVADKIATALRARDATDAATDSAADEPIN